MVNGLDADAATEAAGRINCAVAHPGSPADPKTADALIDRCISEFGRIDILVNCAGTAGLTSESILKVTSAQFHDLIDAHLGTGFETCRAAAPKMIAQGGGAIINTSSFAFLGDYGGTGYPAGKGGVNGLTLAIAAELKEHGVRANVGLPRRQDAAVDRSGVRGPHRRVEPQGAAGRREHTDRTRRTPTRVRGTDLRLPRQ